MLALNVNGMKNDLHAPRTPPFSWEPDQVEVLDSGVSFDGARHRAWRTTAPQATYALNAAQPLG